MIAAQIQQAKADRTPDEVVQGKAPVRPVIETALTENHQAFLRFLTRRLGNRSTAEDVLQNFFLRAVRKADEVRDSDSVIAWLYSVLRSVLMDHYRSETARKRREEAYVQEQLLFGDQSEDMPMEDSLERQRLFMLKFCSGSIWRGNPVRLWPQILVSLRQMPECGCTAPGRPCARNWKIPVAVAAKRASAIAVAGTASIILTRRRKVIPVCTDILEICSGCNLSRFQESVAFCTFCSFFGIQAGRMCS